MKINLLEYEGCFSFDMDAETMEDAALLTRLSMNGIKKVQGIYGSARKDGKFDGSVVIGKHKRASESIPRRK